MNAFSPRQPAAHADRLWKLMQRIETCRHRADLLEEAARFGAQKQHQALSEMARQWRLCAAHIQLLNATSDEPCLAAPSARDGG